MDSKESHDCFAEHAVSASNSLIWFSSNYRVIHLENGLTALLISDTPSFTHRTHRDSSMSTTDEEDVESDGLEGEIDDDEEEDDDDEEDNDDTDGVVNGNLDGEQENDGERSRKPKDTKLVS